MNLKELDFFRKREVNRSCIKKAKRLEKKLGAKEKGREKGRDNERADEISRSDITYDSKMTL